MKALVKQNNFTVHFSMSKITIISLMLILMMSCRQRVPFTVQNEGPSNRYVMVISTNGPNQTGEYCRFHEDFKEKKFFLKTKKTEYSGFTLEWLLVGHTFEIEDIKQTNISILCIDQNGAIVQKCFNYHDLMNKKGVITIDKDGKVN